MPELKKQISSQSKKELHNLLANYKKIGKNINDGIDRVALTKGDKEGRDYFIKLLKENNFEVALLAYETLLKYQPNLVRVYGKVGEIYGKNLNNLPKAEEYLQTAHQIKPDNTDIIQKLGVVFAIQGNTNKALEIFLKGEEIEPENARILMNIGLTYNNIGNTQLGNQYLQKAFEIEPSLQRN